MKARILRPAKTAMQSGRAKTHSWVLEFEPTERMRLDPVMGWAGHGDTAGQVRMKFATEAEAVAFAERHGIDYAVEKPQERRIRPKAYADNFAYGRKIPWSH